MLSYSLISFREDTLLINSDKLRSQDLDKVEMVLNKILGLDKIIIQLIKLMDFIDQRPLNQ